MTITNMQLNVYFTVVKRHMLLGCSLMRKAPGINAIGHSFILTTRMVQSVLKTSVLVYVEYNVNYGVIV